MRETVWKFSTKNYQVRLVIEPEDMNPEDCFEFQEDIDAVRNGTVEWFMACVEVIKNGHVIGRDCLGGCAYSSIQEFITSHRDRDPMNRNCSIMRTKEGKKVSICHYFPDMVHQAIEDARSTLAH